MPYKDPEKRKQLQREWYQKNREGTISRVMARRIELGLKVQEYKLEHGCNRCGYNRSPRALDAHHPNGEGKEGRDSCVARLVRRGFAWEKILVVLESCEIICANCHREEHDVFFLCT